MGLGQVLVLVVVKAKKTARGGVADGGGGGEGLVGLQTDLPGLF